MYCYRYQYKSHTGIGMVVSVIQYNDLAKAIINLEKNKVFVGLGSCNNVQTERPIFESANWQRLQL